MARFVVHGSGDQTRDYVYVEDVVAAMKSASYAEKINRMIINVGSGVETSVHEIVKAVIETTGRKPEIVINKSHDSGPSRLCADLTLAKKKLEYQPKTTLHEGFQKILELDSRFNQEK